MPRTCTIHVGTHKTGSSSIQRTLFENRNLVARRHNLQYFEGYENHSVLYTAFNPTALHFRSLQIAGVTTLEGAAKHAENMRDQLSRSIDRAAGKDYVISGEGLSFLPATTVPAMQEFFARFFDRVRICVYVRHPYGYADSAAQECVKRGETFEQLIAATLDGAAGPSVLPKYRDRIEKYITAFGRENVKIREFDRNKLKNQDVVMDFLCNMLGLDEAGLGFAPEHSNESLSHAVVRQLERLNRTAPLIKDGKLNMQRSTRILRLLKDLPARQRFVFSELDIARFAEVVAEDVAWLSDLTDGAISFDLNKERHEAETDPESELDDHSAVMHAFNEALVGKERSDSHMRIYRELSRLSMKKTTDTKPLETQLSHCRQPGLLVTTASDLAKMGLVGPAKIALERAIHLTDLEPNPKLRRAVRRRLAALNRLGPTTRPKRTVFSALTGLNPFRA